MRISLVLAKITIASIIVNNRQNTQQRKYHASPYSDPIRKRGLTVMTIAKISRWILWLKNVLITISWTQKSTKQNNMSTLSSEPTLIMNKSLMQLSLIFRKRLCVVKALRLNWKKEILLKTFKNILLHNRLKRCGEENKSVSPRRINIDMELMKVWRFMSQ